VDRRPAEAGHGLQRPNFVIGVGLAIASASCFGVLIGWYRRLRWSSSRS
jgi:hypothetical protein